MAVEVKLWHDRIEVNIIRIIIVIGTIIAYAPLWTNAAMHIHPNAEVREALTSRMLKGGILLILGSSASLLADDVLYLFEATRTTKGFQWSRRMLILSIIIPYIFMYQGAIDRDLSLYFCSYNSSFILESYAILDPLVIRESRKLHRYWMIFLAVIRLFGLLSLNFYYFSALPHSFYDTTLIIYVLSIVLLFFTCAYYLYEQYMSGECNIAANSFAICVMANIVVRIGVPLSFGVQTFEDFNAPALFSYLMINLLILVISTILPGRIARHDNILASAAYEKQKIMMRYISHEMRTPLNTIHLGIDELLKLGSFRELLNDMHAASEIAVDTLNDLISQEAVDETVIALDFVEDSAYHFITTLVMQLQRHAMQNNFRLVLDNVANLRELLQSCYIKIDQLKFSQAMRSIIINASRMTHEKGQVNVACKLQQVASNKRSADNSMELVIEITNDGPGISKNARNKIFYATNLNSLDFGTGMGTALSLWTAKRIIERHGGHIEVKSNLENESGCIFCVILPTCPTSTELSVTHTGAPKSQQSQSRSLHVDVTESYNNSDIPLRCLIVDDAPVVRKMIGRVVQDLFATIAYATNGEEAAQLLYRSISSGKADDKFDIIFMDRCMPVKDGIEATRDIRNMGFQGVILGVTGDALAEDVDAFLQAGADKVVTKPLSLEHFVPLIEDYKYGRKQRVSGDFVTAKTPSGNEYKKPLWTIPGP